MRRLLTVRFGLVLVVATLALAALPPSAHAVQYVLNIDQCTGTCGGGPYGTVDVVQAGLNNVTITVTLASGVKFINGGFDGSFDFNLIGNPTISVSPISTGYALISTTAGTLKFDGFGNFEYGIDCTACGKGGSDPQPGPLVFTVTALGLTPDSFKELSTGGGAAAFFAADILGTNGKTGAVGTGTVTAVPEPTTLLLVGSLMVGLGVVWTRRRMRGQLKAA